MLYDPRYDLDVTGKILWGAADDLEAVGWCQGATEDALGRLCVMGAIDRQKRQYNIFERNKALTRLTQHVGGKYLAQWNDEPERTEAEVIAACRGAAQQKG
jgi:hypothetical protein